jgi:hypothetical protein
MTGLLHCGEARTCIYHKLQQKRLDPKGTQDHAMTPRISAKWAVEMPSEKCVITCTRNVV